ncbi:MAG: hypothetical protein GTO24_25915 [candidate division Zixibacteria bacterium]|nr:hypothetical protein [candidate division Zixibacteria bacterium]
MCRHKIFVLVICIGVLTCWTVGTMAEMIVDTAWVRRYDGPAHDYDYGYFLAVDGSSGSVYVTGHSYDSQTLEDFATVKYDASGNEIWVRRYNGPGNDYDFAHAITVDVSGNAYVVGKSWGDGTGYDYATIKYYPNGDTAWVRRYNGPGNTGDAAHDVAADASGNVYVTGASCGIGTGDDITTIKYYPDGDTAWVRTYHNDAESPLATAVDSAGNVYVTGYTWPSTGTDSDYATIKYYPNGDTAWVRTYDGTGEGHHDDACAVAVDGSGNVYVTGFSWGMGTDQDCATVKYDSSGNQIWVQRYNGPGNGSDNAYAIGIDGSDNIYITGPSLGSGTYQDYATVKYDSSGNEIWVRRYNGPENGYDYAHSIAVDGSGSVYVTGVSYGGLTYWDCATVKYDSSGSEIWSKRYNGPDNDYDYAYRIGLDGSGNVYIAGGSYSNQTFWDFVTIRYFQVLRGDANGDGSIDGSDVVYLINYLFRSGDVPDPLEAGDANADGVIGPGDVVYLINYLFRNGPPPCEP